MRSSDEVRSDIAQPVGEVLAKELQKRSMSQTELARRMGRPTQAINEIIKGEKAITSETALQLEKVLDIDARVWLNLDALFQLTQARQREQEQLEAEAQFIYEFPLKEMVKEGWIDKAPTPVEWVKRLRSYFGVASLENLANVRSYAPAFRRAKDSKKYALAVWLHQATVEAEAIRTKHNIAPFDAQKIRESIAAFRQCTLVDPANFYDPLVATLASYGVALVVLTSLKGTYANGATFWDAKGTPVLVVTTRYSFHDIFWFTFFHELGHILLHGKRDGFVETSEKSIPDPELRLMEEEANAFAGETLIPTRPYLSFLNRCNRFFTKEAIRAFAREVKIHPGIVVGRLAHDGFIRHGQFNDLRDKYQITKA